MIKTSINIKITEPISFAFRKLEKTLEDKNIEEGFSVVVSRNELFKEQCYSICQKASSIEIEANSDSGFMYALLYLERYAAHNDTFEGLGEVSSVPQIQKRGIKLNVPLDGRTPSYSDSSDSAQLNIINMWDFTFWSEFIDRMAENHYNVLSLWTLSPFPSLVKIPEFPNVALDDVKRTTKYFNATLEGENMYTSDMHTSLITLKKMTMDEKIDFWRKVMQYAKDRCVEVLVFTWNIFVYGTEHAGYGIDCDQHNPVTRRYYYCGMKALMETYPLLSGIGVTSGENMLKEDSDIDFTRETYGKAVEDYLKEHPERQFRFIHRIQYTRYDSIMEKFADFSCPFEISFKYSQAHMYASTKPPFIDSFMKEKKQDIKIWLTVRNDDYYMYRWGDPEFARGYIKNMPSEHMTGFYMGADGFTWGRDYMDMRDLSHPLFIDKMWYMFMIWGWSAYYSKLPADFFKQELSSRYVADGSYIYEAWKHASSIITIVNCTHWHDFDFQWYPEACCMYHNPPEDKMVFADIYEFMDGISISSGEYHSVKEYSELLAAELSPDKKTPIEAADDIFAHAQYVKDNLAKLKDMAENSLELLHTIDDMEALSYLGIYYSLKIRAAVHLSLYKAGVDIKGKDEAVGLLKEAILYWKKYSNKSKQMYKPQVLTRIKDCVDVERFDELTELDVLLAQEL